MQRVDVSKFRPAANLEGEGEEDTRLLRVLVDVATEFVKSQKWAPPLNQLHLAFGVGGVIGFFLVEFEHGIAGDGHGDQDVWIVVADLPSIYFETGDIPTPADALRTYCEIAEIWADRVIAGADISDCYPIPVAPMCEHAEMLKGRITSIREIFIPVA